MTDPAANAAAFQVALWEVVQEPTLPPLAAGGKPFDLYGGGFRANYADPSAAPEFVQGAQRYVQSLTGDDAAFANSNLLRGSELVRLTGTAGPDGVVPQSQLSLRPSAANLSAGVPGGGLPTGIVGGPGGYAPLGGLGRGLGGAPLGGLGGGFGGAPGLVGGFGGGNGTTVAATPVTSPLTPIIPPGTATNPGGNSPQTPVLPPSIFVPPVGPPIVVIPPGTTTPPGENPPGDNPPVKPPLDPPAVPAPPAVVLGLVGAGLIAAQRLRNRRRAGHAG